MSRWLELAATRLAERDGAVFLFGIVARFEVCFSWTTSKPTLLLVQEFHHGAKGRTSPTKPSRSEPEPGPAIVGVGAGAIVVPCVRRSTISSGLRHHVQVAKLEHLSILGMSIQDEKAETIEVVKVCNGNSSILNSRRCCAQARADGARRDLIATVFAKSKTLTKAEQFAFCTKQKFCGVSAIDIANHSIEVSERSKAALAKISTKKENQEKVAVNDSRECGEGRLVLTKSLPKSLIRRPRKSSAAV